MTGGWLAGLYVSMRIFRRTAIERGRKRNFEEKPLLFLIERDFSFGRSQN